MQEDTRYIGLDVHAISIEVVIAEEGRTGEVRHLGRISNRPESVRKLVKKLGPVERLYFCFEAGPCGYGLYRQLVSLGARCDVIAPTLIPRKPGDRVKTNRRDAMKLARCLRAGELTAVHVPGERQEALRDVVRAREAAKDDQKRARNRLGKFLLRRGLRKPSGMKSWGSRHLKWIRALHFELAGAESTFLDYLAEVDHQAERMKRIAAALDLAVAEADAVTQELISALQSLRGVGKLTAISLVAEVGRFSRFSKASQIMGYSGVVSSEYSTGEPEKARRGGITKTGNNHLRRLLIESAWHYRHRPALGVALRKRQQGLAPAVLEHAWQAQHRLYKRYCQMIRRGKPSQKVVTAVGRELLGFIWAIGRTVEDKYLSSPEGLLLAA